uniref:Uncharacterized protein n=1 Tax=Candidatus Kentrum sp. LPFa TaxID=2126335 RepID=A0A450WAU4_9GAMM|nr:MAG: hypothetical protein BECKLPF1236B_GA0070989_105723 [Candidatus Kentron sp. LPFa]
MNKKSLLRIVMLFVVLGFPWFAYPTEQSDIMDLKRMLAEMQHEYESRIKALEARIEKAEAKVLAAEATRKTEQQFRALTPDMGEAPEKKSFIPQRDGNSAFNPAISLVLQASAASYSQDPETWRMPGFLTGGESGLKTEGLSLTETELTASANVDDWFYSQATIGLHEHDGDVEVDLEEAFVETLALPAGLGLQAGRFLTETGYLNTHHSDSWDFADAPLTSQAFLGKQYRDDGLRG